LIDSLFNFDDNKKVSPLALQKTAIFENNTFDNKMPSVWFELIEVLFIIFKVSCISFRMISFFENVK